MVWNYTFPPEAAYFICSRTSVFFFKTCQDFEQWPDFFDKGTTIQSMRKFLMRKFLLGVVFFSSTLWVSMGGTSKKRTEFHRIT